MQKIVVVFSLLSVPIDDSPSESNDQIDVKVTPSKSSGVLVISSSPDTFDNTPVSTSPDSWDEKLKHIVLIRDPKSPMTGIITFRMGSYHVISIINKPFQMTNDATNCTI